MFLEKNIYTRSPSPHNSPIHSFLLLNRTVFFSSFHPFLFEQVQAHYAAFPPFSYDIKSFLQKVTSFGKKRGELRTYE